MAITLELGDLLTSKGALLIPIDGAAEGLEGRLGRLLARKAPEVWELVSDELPLPMELGEVCAVALPEGSPWPGVVAAATLHHADVLDLKAKQAVIRTALAGALDACAAARWPVLATAVLAGGWRLREEDALAVMLGAYEQSPARARVGLEVWVLEPAVQARLLPLAAALGLRR